MEGEGRAPPARGWREGTPRGRPPLAEAHPCQRSMRGSKSPLGRGPGSEGKALGTQLAPVVRALLRGRCEWGSWARWEPEPEARGGLAPSSRPVLLARGWEVVPRPCPQHRRSVRQPWAGMSVGRSWSAAGLCSGVRRPDPSSWSGSLWQVEERHGEEGKRFLLTAKLSPKGGRGTG